MMRLEGGATMHFDEYVNRDATDLATLIRKGEIGPAEAVEAAIGRAEAVNGQINAIVTPTFDAARTAAATATGELAGVPFLVKDLTYLEGVPCSYGSRLWDGFVPDHDAEIVARYRRAGLVFLGKSNTPEVGLAATTESVRLGPCRNPWDLARTPGGSSGGAAAAVAAGIVPAAHATDGGGSIRIPASCCGLVGLKPTRARTPMGPDVGEGWGSMAVGHVVSRSVRDCARLLDLTHGPATGDPYYAPPFPGSFVEAANAPLPRLKIAIDLAPVSSGTVHEACREGVARTAALLESLGHRVEERPPDIDREVLTLATGTLVVANVANNVHARVESLGVDLSAELVEHLTLRMADAGRLVSAEVYARSINAIHAIGRRLAGFFEDWDLILSPTLLQPPVSLGYMNTNDPDGETYAAHFNTFWGFTSLYNATGMPAVSLPLHWTADGLPVGMQFAAPFGQEALLLKLATELESAQPWFDRRASLDL
jgi:Asp-tRNA(Asn)/Glu-tRNA(Gln) amidotransferase A subunit family amidase